MGCIKGPIGFDKTFEIDRLRVFLGVRFDTNSERIQSLMEQLGKAVRSSECVYFTSGVSTVLLEQVDGQLIRYPAVDALTLKQRVLEPFAEL